MINKPFTRYAASVKPQMMKLELQRHPSISLLVFGCMLYVCLTSREATTNRGDLPRTSPGRTQVSGALPDKKYRRVMPFVSFDYTDMKVGNVSEIPRAGTASSASLQLPLPGLDGLEQVQPRCLLSHGLK